MPFLKPHLIQEMGDQPVASIEKSSFSVKSEILRSDEEYADTVDKNPSDIGQANIILADNEKLYIKVEKENSLLPEVDDQTVASTEKSSFSIKSEVLCSDEEYADTIDKNPLDIGQANMSLADAYERSRFPLVSYKDHDDKADHVELNLKVEEEDSVLLKGGDHPVSSTEKSSFSSFKCTICHKTFQLQRYLNAHLEIHSSEQTLPTKNFKCTICSKTFQRPRYLKAHLEIHSSEQTHPTKNFKCTICSKTFQRPRYLKAHLEIHSGKQRHPTEDFKCTICSKTFQLQRYLNAHLKIHSSKQRHLTEDFKCTICSKTFQFQRYLNTHLKRHSTKRTMQCDHCQRCFKTFCSLKKHLKKKHVHGETTFLCSICDKPFCSQKYLTNHLKRHLEIHSSEQMHPTKKFKCSICSKTFQRPRYLKAHLEIHSNKQRHPTVDFKCTICSKTFLFQRYLNTHLKIHSTKRTMQCDHCQRCFKTFSSLKKHLKKNHVHGETTFLCSICDKPFCSQIYLTNHLKRHSFLKPHLIWEGGEQPVSSTEKSSFSVESEVLSSDKDYADTIDMNSSDVGQANINLADANKKLMFPLVTYEDHDDKADKEELDMNVEEEDSLLPDSSNNSASVSSNRIVPLESSCDIEVEEKDSLLPDNPENSASLSSFQILSLESSCVVNKSVDPVSREQKHKKKMLTSDLSGEDPDLEHFKGFLSLVKELSSKKKQKLFDSFAQELFRLLDEQKKEETDSTDI